ncbi:SNF2 family N-terminal domain-containing protein [Xylariomycetidae sp. FL2044]|nr:SNF2 family N-terminal domain-containing protein [Xylariomycetidae sp. FL2044]
MASDSDAEENSLIHNNSNPGSLTERINAVTQSAPATDLDTANDPIDTLDETTALQNLTANVRDQDDIERDITHQANLALIDAEDKRDEKRIEKAEANIHRLKGQKKNQEERLRKALGKPDLKQKIRAEIARIDADIELNQNDIADFRTRIEQRHDQGNQAGVVQGGNQKLPNETHRDFLIRTGKITPFAKIGGPRPAGVDSELANVLADAEDQAAARDLEEEAGYEPRSHRNLRAPGFAEIPDLASTATESEFSLRPRKKRKVRRDTASSDEYTPTKAPAAPEADFVANEDESDDYDLTERPRKKSKKKTKDDGKDDAKVDFSQVDDGNEASYQARLADWVERRSRARLRLRQDDSSEPPEQSNGVLNDDEEWFKPSPDHPDHVFKNGIKLPGDIYPALFDYQKTCVQWLSELYFQNAGGIIGDEMGLGKTVQLISFIAALHYSKRLDKPVIVVAPATLLRQWANEFHRWWPPLRVSILHTSGSGMLNVKHEGMIEAEELAWDDRRADGKVSKAAKRIVDRVVTDGHVLITSYAGLQTYGKILIPVEWAYAVLDEGHKIRNPNTAITVYCKELRTPHRVILSGTPMQNNLMELWSLFDFVFPMRLGTLVDFRNQFEIPIKIGGYANASNLQIMTAQKCAETLKDAIHPFLLQRLKADVASDLPKKMEQVLFCKLTRPQRDAYEIFLNSSEMSSILNRKMQSLFGIDILRKICNHPDLVDPKLEAKVGYKWGMANKSGKMQVVKALLPMWKRLGHKTLLFSQGVQMLRILESFVQRLGDIKYLRMDGSTPIKERQTLVDQFNNDPEIDLFLLTTKVGGLGVNLTGASRVIIFDPDWNPSTDMQARERAWRLGQKKEVTIYRLMTAGTIEEKIYHRQIFKQFLTNKVLKDPKSRTTIAQGDLKDLFTLGSTDEGATDTGKLFEGSESYRYSKSAAESGTKVSATEATGNENGEASSTADGNDLRNVTGVASMEDYSPALEDKPASTEEARIMEGIFARSGVHSALEHDAIINNKGKPQADPRILMHEANRVAAEAAASLRRAQEQARSVPIGRVTWTGEVGDTGRPSNIRRGRGGPGSAGILAGLADRQGLSSAANGSSNRNNNSSTPSITRSATPSSGPNPQRPLRHGEFKKLIRDFIDRHGGQVASKVLVDHFGQYCGSSTNKATFSEALHDIAEVKTKGSSRLRSLWALKKGV